MRDVLGDVEMNTELERLDEGRESPESNMRDCRAVSKISNSSRSRIRRDVQAVEGEDYSKAGRQRQIKSQRGYWEYGQML